LPDTHTAVIDNGADDSVPHSQITSDGMVRLHVDIEAFDIYLDAHPCYDAAVMARMLARCEQWGLELIDPEECEPELLSSGWVRTYLTPHVPEEVVEAEAVVSTLNLNVRALRGPHTQKEEAA
jgi:hypothetical protein